jgi:type IV pilus assembly protein PilC
MYSGYIVADSKASVIRILAESKVILKSITCKRTFKTLVLGNYIRAQDLLSFTQQTSATLVSGLTLLNAIKLAASYQNNSILKYLLANIISDLESGISLSVSISKYPKIFNTFYCNMVKIAESSGNPNLVFTKLTNYLQQIEHFKQKIYKILLYPALLILLTLLVLMWIVLLVIPQFTSLYNNLGGSLPVATKLIVNLSNFINNNFLVLFFSQLITISLCVVIYKYSSIFVKMVDKILLSVPIFGSFFHKLILAKSINILYVTYTAGASLPECLHHAKLVSKNHIYINFINDLITRISNGESFKLALSRGNFFPTAVINILGLGDESSNLAEMLKYLASFYDRDIQRTFDIISSLSEPLIMIFLGLIIGFLVFTIYYPIINIGGLV